MDGTDFDNCLKIFVSPRVFLEVYAAAWPDEMGVRQPLPRDGDEPSNGLAEPGAFLGIYVGESLAGGILQFQPL
jgi:hypothetical protein